MYAIDINKIKRQKKILEKSRVFDMFCCCLWRPDIKMAISMADASKIKYPDRGKFSQS